MKVVLWFRSQLKPTTQLMGRACDRINLHFYKDKSNYWFRVSGNPYDFVQIVGPAGGKKAPDIVLAISNPSPLLSLF